MSCLWCSNYYYDNEGFNATRHSISLISRAESVLRTRAEHQLSFQRLLHDKEKFRESLLQSTRARVLRERGEGIPGSSRPFSCASQ